MGWDFTFGATRKDIIRQATDEWKTEAGGTGKSLRHCCKGNVIYILWEITRPDVPVMRFIEVVLMKKSREGWGCKKMDETMEPYYYECPISYIEIAGPSKYESAQKWRDEVRLRHEIKKRFGKRRRNEKDIYEREVL